MRTIWSIRTPRGEPGGLPLRIAVVSTPRSGNTWFRYLLATTYELPDFAVHNPAEVDWEGLSGGCLLQLHWHRVGAFTSRLDRHGFRVVVLSRHPLDVLISILNFAPHQPDTARWLEGEAGDESSILGASPCSPAFLEYATGPRASALLGVSHEWRRARGCRGVRYEDLVGDTAGELGRITRALGHPASEEAISRAIAAHTLENLRTPNRNPHFWQGRPGLWKALIPASEAHRIARAHRAVFRGGGYACDPDPGLDRSQAEANWLQVVNPASASRAKARLRRDEAAVAGPMAPNGLGHARGAEAPWREIARRVLSWA